MSNEVIESAKATQEVAKTARKALDTSEKFGGFISRYIGGSLEQSMGIIEDKLKYMRWERQHRLINKAEQFLKQEGLDSPDRAVPIKIMVPLLEGATLEEDDALQNTWAALLTNYGMQKSGIEPHRSYISILEQLSSTEAIIISKVYASEHEEYDSFLIEQLPDKIVPVPKTEDAASNPNYSSSQNPLDSIKIAIGNLERLGMLNTSRTWAGRIVFHTISKTHLGTAFYDACTLPSER